jgi:hypothetical protein
MFVRFLKYLEKQGTRVQFSRAYTVLGALPRGKVAGVKPRSHLHAIVFSEVHSTLLKDFLEIGIF